MHIDFHRATDIMGNHKGKKEKGKRKKPTR